MNNPLFTVNSKVKRLFPLGLSKTPKAINKFSKTRNKQLKKQMQHAKLLAIRKWNYNKKVFANWNITNQRPVGYWQSRHILLKRG